MKNRNIVLISVVFGLLTSLLVYRYISDLEKSLDNREYREVVVAKTDLAAKSLLTRDSLEMKKVPLEYLHPLALESPDQAVGNITLWPLVKGEEILSKKIARPDDAKNGLSYVIPVGKRALTVAVDEVSGVAGMVKPGDHVDIAAAVNIQEPGTDREIPYGLIVLQDLQVLAVGSTTEDKPGGPQAAEYKTVTLAVTAEQSRPLVIACQKGNIRLMLRSPVDNSTTQTTPFKAADFLN